MNKQKGKGKRETNATLTTTVIRTVSAFKRLSLNAELPENPFNSLYCGVETRGGVLRSLGKYFEQRGSFDPIMNSIPT